MDGIYRIKPMTEIINEKTVMITDSLNEYEIASYIGISLAALFLLAAILSWAAQWSWAWIDDKKEIDGNWFLEIFDVERKIEGENQEYKYQVNYGLGGIAGYSKNKDHEGMTIREIDDDDYISYYKVTRDRFEIERYWGYFWCAFTFAPMTILIMAKLYPLTLSIGILVAVAILARFSRRTQKLFIEHTKDKDAHKK